MEHERPDCEECNDTGRVTTAPLLCVDGKMRRTRVNCGKCGWRKSLTFSAAAAVESLETALAAMTAERDARDVALRAAVASCKCRGTGQVQRWCTLCGDSTFDHDCNDRMEDCDRDWCIAARAVLARAAVEGER